MDAHIRLMIAILALTGILTVGAIGFVLIEKVDIGEAAYMTLITVSTVGFGEQWDLSSAGKLWTSLIIMVGVLVVTMVFASVQAMIVGGEIRTVLGRRKLKDRIGRLREHFIVCGYGRMGKLISHGLRSRGKSVVVIDDDPERTVKVGEDGMEYVLGDATDEASLQAAGIERAAAVVSVLRNDPQNVYVTLTAAGMRSDVTIMARAEYPASEQKLIKAGASQVICPQTIGATRMLNLLVRPSLAHVVDIVAADTDWELDEFPIAKGSALAGQTLSALDLRRRIEATVFALRQANGELKLSPNPDTCLEVGDILIVIGPAGVTEALARIDSDRS
ncbi:MAG: potassium channel protein [Planctomycetota bacterium]|nr:potassium channel protein [Planctomycetota bacterium]